MSVTIKDVAKRANVSPSTVSRVLSDNPKISDKTKKKVRKVIDEMGYHLNYNARVLAQKSTKTIGVVMKNFIDDSAQSSFFPEVLRGISAICSKSDYSISLTTGESEEEIYNDVVQMVGGKRVDGLIVLYSKEDDKVVPFLLESEIPFVLIGKPFTHSSEIMYIDNDNVQAAYDATNYLISLGHKRIAYIGGDPAFEVNQARLIGYRKAMEAKGLSINEDYVKSIESGIDQGKNMIRSILKLQERPTAFFASDDKNALLTLFVLYENGIKVPEEISLICFNHSIHTELATPTITSVDIHTYQLGYEAGKNIIELINDPKKIKASTLIPSVIVEKESCKPLKQDIS